MRSSLMSTTTTSISKHFRAIMAMVGPALQAHGAHGSAWDEARRRGRGARTAAVVVDGQLTTDVAGSNAGDLHGGGARSERGEVWSLCGQVAGGGRDGI